MNWMKKWRDESIAFGDGRMPYGCIASDTVMDNICCVKYRSYEITGVCFCGRQEGAF